MRKRLGLRQREPAWTVARRRQRQVAVGNGMDCATKEAAGGGGGSRNQCGLQHGGGNARGNPCGLRYEGVSGRWQWELA